MRLLIVVLACAQLGECALLGSSLRPIGHGPVSVARVHRVSALTMGVDQRWPQIVRSYVTAKFKAVDVDASGQVPPPPPPPGSRSWLPLPHKLVLAVDRSEVTSLLRGLMPAATEERIDEALTEFFTMYDADGSGDIDEEEFFVAVMSNRLLNSDMRLKEQVYCDVLNTFKRAGAKLLGPTAFTSLEAQLDWEGSNVPLEYAELSRTYV
ncbi:hypothetical protein T492DRAFT_1145130 [Pavlovales sp. CCMP2436]|nr:hypothetical protein T492DRAFT_1145130 [Pavlovales sp. CCMP2436]